LKILKKNNIEKSGISIFVLVVILLVLIFHTGCSTKKNTSTTRAYHNLTARYNVYFNGNESLKAGERQIKKAYKEDYTRILPVFRYEDVAVSTMISSEMDLAIKKCAKTIKTHSITVKPKFDKKSISKEEKDFLTKQEYCKWIDDSYLLMGKAHFYKREFETALQTFILITNKYKKESSIDEAILWIAKTYVEMGDYKNTENTLLELKKSKRWDKQFNLEMDLVYSSMYMKQKDYNNAALKLNAAIKNEKRKKEKARQIFILAQIYQYDSKFNLAIDNYKKVIKMNPEYDMTFATNIHLAEIFEKTGTSSGDLKKQLLKMVKDEKNIDYLDQLYYALGKIELNDKNTEKAIEYFQLSASSVSSNKTQKVKTYLVLAEYYYENKNYKLAEAYFDSTATSIEKTYDDYDKVNKQILSLRDLTHNLNVIDKEDSLQLLAKMPEKDRNTIIDNIIQKIIEEEQRQNEAKKNSDFDPFLMDNNDYSRNSNQMEGGKFYFYNPSTISIGQTEFKKRWGDRKLEDSWRRSNKQITADIQEIVTNTDTLANKAQEDKSKITNIKSREFYIQDIPLTEERITESNKRIEKAMYNSAEIYYKQLNDLTNAANQFEKFLLKFSDSDYRIETLRNLNTIYNKEMKFAEAERCKQLIIKEFPESTYAKLLQDPGYADMLKTQQSELKNLYLLAYNAYKNNDYTQTIGLCENAEAKYTENELQPNFLYLKALSYGGNGNKTKLKENLELLVAKFPESEPALIAIGTLDVLNSKKLDEEIYSIQNDSLHYYLLVFPKNKIDVNKLKFKYIKLNAEQYTQDDLNISVQTLDSERDFIFVQAFKNANSAITYFQSVIINNVLEDVHKITPTHFVISKANYEIYIKNKQDIKYMNFFDKNYLLN